jgi:flavin reductase (DIM6/NTAB) family NADH-FMN oxidoreductase RutF
MLTTELPCLQELPPTEPIDQGDEGEWDTVGEAAGSRSPAPTVEELLAQMECQPPAAQESTEPAAAAAEEVVATEAQEEAPTEAGLVDIASILGAPTVMVVRSSLKC